MRRAVLFAQLLALTGACRSDRPQSSESTSGGEQRPSVDPSPSHVVTTVECSAQSPDNRLCATAEERCSGSSVSCAQASPGEFAPCGGAQWQCQCTAQGAVSRWRCQQQMHAAGPLPPPELSA